MTIIRVIDLECTGLEPTDEVVEIGAVDVAINTHTKAFEEIRTFGSAFVRAKKSIPPEASAIHHILDEDIAEAELWNDVWPIYLSSDVTLFAAHNAAFEGQFLTEEMRQRRPLICTYKAALRVWPDAPNHKNQTLRYWLRAQGEFPRTEVTGAVHRALDDAAVTAWILIALLKKATLSDMIAWSKEPALLPTCPIGEWRGKKWSDVDAGFLKWMIQKPVDDPDLVWNAQHELKRRWNEEDVRRKVYVDMAKQAIPLAQSIDDLNGWFISERDLSFPKYGITPETGEYKIIVAACAERKAQLQQQETANASAA